MIPASIPGTTCYDLGRKQDFYWKAYLRRMEEAGASRESKTLV